MADDKNGKMRLIEILLSVLILMCSGLGGWALFNSVETKTKVAEIDRQVAVNTERLSRLERDGTPGLVTHVKDDDTRVANMTKQIETLTDFVKQSNDLKVEVRVMGTKIDERLGSISERLKRIEENAAVVKLKGTP